MEEQNQVVATAKELSEVGDGNFTELEKLDYEQFIKDPENKLRAENLAKEIVEIVGDNWFTLRRFQNKTKLAKEVAFTKLSFVKMFGFLLHKEEKVKEGKYWVKLTQYKVAIDDVTKVAEINRAIEYYQYQIKELEKQRDGLLAKTKA